MLEARLSRFLVASSTRLSLASFYALINSPDDSRRTYFGSLGISVVAPRYSGIVTSGK
jgi:hypothetical protein